MSLTLADAVVHSNIGGVSTSSTSTAITVSLAGADTTDENNAVVVVLAGYVPAGASGLSVLAPSGWRAVWTGATGGSVAILYRTSVDGLAAGESSWNFTPATVATGSNPVTWAVLELGGLDPENLVDVAFSGAFDAGTGTTTTTAGTTKTTAYDELMFGVHIFNDASSATPATWGSHTNSFAEVVETGQAGTGVSVGMSVSALPVSTINTFNVGATANATFLANEAFRGTFSVLAKNASREIDLTQLDGGESTNVTGSGAITGGVTLDAAAARSGGYGYLLSSTAAACNKTFPAGTGSFPTFRFHFRVPDLTDRAQIFYATVSFTGGTSVLTGRLSSGLIGLTWPGGTEVFSDQSVTANQWVGVNLRVDRRSTPFRADWSVDYNAELTDTTPAVVQTVALAVAVPSGTFIGVTFRAGWSSALTSVMHVDDYGAAPGHNYPIGDLRVLPLKVDPAGTPTCTVATTNFGVMTANGTVAAWNATNARNAVDDIPPIPAGNGSRDAAVAVLAHATDTANFPMETVDLAANKLAVRGAKAHWWIWAASATTATIRVFVYDGTTTFTMYAEADPGADNVTMVYDSGMVRSATVPNWTQPKVDGLTFQFGSNDATPDIGLDAMLIELAVIKALPENLFGAPGEPIYVEAHRDPATQALVGAAVTNNSGDAVKLAWEVSGTPADSGSIPNGTTGQYVPLSADGSIETVGTVSLIPG